MKPHPRLRRAALVSSAVVSVMLIGVWIASARWHVLLWHRDDTMTAIGSGWLEQTYQGRTGLQNDRHYWYFFDVNRAEGPVPFRWWFSYWRNQGLYGVAIPLWFPAGLSLLGTAAVWRLYARARRRARVGACAKCGYDRAGLAPPDAKCPECGTATAAAIGRLHPKEEKPIPPGLRPPADL